MRIGIGYDVHRLAIGHRLVLGGVDIPSEQGLIGWSDADVLTHAIIDALLGAAALGDIGKFFPPGDPQYQGISSLILLEKVRDMLRGKGWQIVNIDATIVAERPKLGEYIEKMCNKLGSTVGIDTNCVSVKASTSEQLGFAGREEGIITWAVASISEVNA
ncbi:MAG: 2-C-methyl-D-erythritol 2,4-cyclodiphosphate synthase [Dehalococcoidia bacterium]|nr:MAG: 2-C-methyl-D-erythritol 2,4-cyclodiphosphate synthase [Dehalococcoidia bacterium]